MTTSAARRTRNRLVSGAVVVVLAAINVTDHLLHPPWWVRALEGAALLAWARLDRLSWSQLGLGRDRLASGCRWALGAIGVVAGVYVVGVLLPLTRPASWAPSSSRRSAGGSSASCAGAAAACWRARGRTGRPTPSACSSVWWPGAWVGTRDRLRTG